ncbi:MAG: hypothetical protein AAFV80_03450 [Bacteroidota bacterium]
MKTTIILFILLTFGGTSFLLAQQSSGESHKEIGIWKQQKQEWGTPASSSANGMLESYWRFKKKDGSENMELTWVFDAQGRLNRSETTFNLFEGNASFLLVNQPMFQDNFQYFNTNYFMQTGPATRFIVRW